MVGPLMAESVSWVGKSALAVGIHDGVRSERTKHFTPSKGTPLHADAAVFSINEMKHPIEADDDDDIQRRIVKLPCRDDLRGDFTEGLTIQMCRAGSKEAETKLS